MKLFWNNNVAYYHSFRIERGVKHGREVFALGELKTSLIVFEKIETLINFLSV